MREIKPAAKCFGSPAATANQPAEARQENAPTRTTVLARAANRAQPHPRNIRSPQAADITPKVPPEINAVLAAEGFERNPAIPQTTRNTPNAINHCPRNVIVRDKYPTPARQDTRKKIRLLAFLSRCGHPCRPRLSPCPAMHQRWTKAAPDVWIASGAKVGIQSASEPSPQGNMGQQQKKAALDGLVCSKKYT